MASAQEREDALVALALQTPADQRAHLLDAVCGEDRALRQRLEAKVSRAVEAHNETMTTVGSPLSAVHGDTVPASWVDAPDEVIGQTLGRYKLLERVGEGGCGVVYVAEQTEPVRRRVALKVIKLGMDTRAVVARFEAERQALAIMDHPNIAKVLDAGATETGRPYFVMELVRGIKITDYCDQNRLSTRDRIQIFIKICHAIQHAHQKGIIHRDIKPSNILVTLHDGVPVPKVIDFGIAKATEGRLTDATVYTQLHQFIGTPAYMSPEQAEMSGLDVDTRSDIYSLGVLLYELLTGRTPFDATDLMSSGIDAMRRTIRELEPAAPSTRVATLQGEELTTTATRRSAESSKLLSQLRGDLDWIVMKCLEKDRTRRYETANALAADLTRHLQNEPVSARPPSSIYRFQKAFRRNKVAFAAGGAVFVALLLGLIVSLWQYAGKSAAEREQNRLRVEAEQKATEARQAQAQAAQQRDLARERLFDSYVREARSVRKARQIGYREEAFTRIKEALALATANLEPGVLRSEAVACMGDWVGLTPIDFQVPGRVAGVALSGDGSLVAITSWDGRVSIRETRTGREVSGFDAGGITFGLTFDVAGIALYMSVLEERIVIGERPGAARIEKWALRGDGTWRQEWKKPRNGSLGCFHTTRGPVVLVLGPDDAYLAVEEAETGEEIFRIALESRMPWLPMATISSDRRLLALLSRDQATSFDVQLEVWDLRANRRTAQIKPRLGPGWGLSFGSTARALAVTYDNTLLVHDTAQFSTFINMGGAFERSFGGSIGGASDGLLAVPSVQEFGVRLIQLQSGGEVAYLKLPGVPVDSRFNPNGSLLLLAYDLGARLVRLRLDQEKVVLEGHQGGVPSAEFSPDGRTLISCGKDRTLRKWDLSSGTSTVLGALPAPGQTIAFSADGEYLVCGYYNTSELSLWSVRAGKQVATIPAAGESTTWACATSPDGNRLAAIGAGLRTWDWRELVRSAKEGTSLPSAVSRATLGVAGVCFEGSGKAVLYQGLQDGSSNQLTTLVRQRLEGDSAPAIVATNVQINFVQPISVLNKRGELAYVTREREIAVIRSSTGETIRKIPTRQPGEAGGWYVANLRASPDERTFALVTVSGLGVEIRDVATGELLYALPEESGSIWWLAWHPDSRRLAVTRANGEISVWNLGELEEQLAKLELPVSTSSRIASPPMN